MTRDELKERLFEVCAESALSVADRVSALRVVMTRVQMNVTPGLQKARKLEMRAPLLRPSGKMMGKHKSQPKD